MARLTHRLNPARSHRSATGAMPTATGFICPSVTAADTWVYLYRWHGRRVELGLGSASAVSLARARELAREHRTALADGVNPKEARKPKGARTFAECASDYVRAHRSEWTNHKHAREWATGFQRLAPVLLSLPVEAIDTEAVLGALQPIWETKRETASRLRGRIELVLDAAKALGLRSGENPARWRGHLDSLLSRPPKQSLKEHLPALPYKELPALMARLRERDSVTSRALEFSILVGARADEVVSAQWWEFDLDAAVWTVPAMSMKGRTAHRVPLLAVRSRSCGKWRRLRKAFLCFPAASVASRSGTML